MIQAILIAPLREFFKNYGASHYPNLIDYVPYKHIIVSMLQKQHAESDLPLTKHPVNVTVFVDVEHDSADPLAGNPCIC